MPLKLPFRMLGSTRVIHFVSDMVPVKQIKPEEDRMVIFVRDGIPFNLSINVINVLNGMVLIAADSLEIGHVDIEVDKINNVMRLYNLKREITISDLNPELDAMLETDGEAPLELNIQVFALEDDSGEMKLYMRTADDIGIIAVHPILIGKLDPQTIKILDPDAVPDSVPASTTEEDEW